MKRQASTKASLKSNTVQTKKTFKLIYCIVYCKTKGKKNHKVWKYH